MKTSYFAKYKDKTGAISISLFTPSWYKCTEYKKLAPPYSLLKAYKDKSIGDTEYTTLYYKHVLNNLDPLEVYNELGEDAVLLCYEKTGDFCHRHIVADWLSKNLGIIIEEV